MSVLTQSDPCVLELPNHLQNPPAELCRGNCVCPERSVTPCLCAASGVAACTSLSQCSCIPFPRSTFKRPNRQGYKCCKAAEYPLQYMEQTLPQPQALRQLRRAPAAASSLPRVEVAGTQHALQLIHQIPWLFFVFQAQIEYNQADTAFDLQGRTILFYLQFHSPHHDPSSSLAHGDVASQSQNIP